ncbi:MAG: Zinc carboxypeptidase [Lentisphaerae bacterium ADurb.Bin242]|nr:MAG: Zinc carboxypeptidase [Lentisphaerae bacterium ADurb.Bin242]
MITVRGYSGDAPSPVRVDRSGDLFRVYAYSETDRESFRLDLELVNDASGMEKITLDITWPTLPFSELRDCLYFHTGSGWKSIFGRTAPGKSYFELEVPQGIHGLSLHPRYSLGDLAVFLAELDGKAEHFTCGPSEHGRALHGLRFGASGGRRFLITARNHANETAGCFAVEGMAAFLLSDDPLARYALTRNEFYLIPVTNPDGTAEGMARYSSPGGADMHRPVEWNRMNRPCKGQDAALTNLFAFYEKIAPDCFINLHSYLFKFKDEIFAPDEVTARDFTAFMPDQTDFGKSWHYVLNDQRELAAGWTAQKTGKTLPLTFELSWFLRDESDMREMGRRIIRAALLQYSRKGETAWGEL